jgi:CRP-like cAMP-binding protein
MSNHPSRSSQLTSFLASVPAFSGIGERSISQLASSCYSRKLKKGELLFGQSEIADELYVVRTGIIAIFLSTLDGRELVINEMRPGDCFGELSLITNRPRSTGALAREASEIISIPRQSFMATLRDEPDLMRQVLETTARRLRMSSERESALAFLDCSARLSRVLLQFDDQTGGFGTVEITQEELALYVGQARQTVARKLGEWRRAGWVSTHRGRIQILDREALKKQTQAD